MLLPVALLVVAVAQVPAQVEPRTISVSGEAEVKVAPDQVIVTLAAEDSEEDLGKAVAKTDGVVKRLVALTQEFKIEPRHVQTSEITISPRYRDSNEREITGYQVRKGVVVCLRDLGRFDAFLAAAIKAGANRVDGVQFQNTELRKYRDQARQMAIRAAKEKAVALAGELGQKIGKPRNITEGSTGYFPRSYSMQTQNAMASSDGVSEASGGFAPGQISISATVSVVFELE